MGDAPLTNLVTVAQQICETAKAPFLEAQYMLVSRELVGHLREALQSSIEPKCPCGTAYLRVEGGYVPVCACAAKNSVPVEPRADDPLVQCRCGWLGKTSELAPNTFGQGKVCPGCAASFWPATL